MILCLSYRLNIWDVGGQKSLRSYWRNYFECTDGLIWVVDSADRSRLDDCARELRSLLVEEVLFYYFMTIISLSLSLSLMTSEHDSTVYTIFRRIAATRRSHTVGACE